MKEKILIITDHKTGGAAIVAKETAEILAGDDYIIKSYWGSDNFKFSLKNYLFNFRAYNDIKLILNEFLPDKILLHNFDNLLSPLILKAIKDFKKVHNCTVIMTCHDYHIISPSNSMTYFRNGEKLFFNDVPNIFELLSVRIDNRSYFHGLVRIFQWSLYYSLLKYNDVIDCFTCPSRFIQTKLEQRFKNKSIHLLYNPSSFIPIDFPKETISYKKIKIVFIGRLTDDKGIFDFLYNFKNYTVGLESKKNIEFIIIGDGPNYNKIEKLSSHNNDLCRISLRGYLSKEEIRNILIESHFILLPSLVYENAPLSLVEGSFCQCNIITMNYGGMKEIANKFNSSILIDDFSEKSITSLLSKIENFDRVNEVEFHEFVNSYSKEYFLKKFKGIF